VLTGSGSAQGIGFRDSATGRFVINAVTLGDECAFWRFTNETTFSAVTTNQAQIEWRADEVWLKIVDDNTNIYSFVSADGIRWFETGSEVRTAWLATADQVFWGISERGEVGKFLTCNAFVEHIDDVPIGYEYEAQSMEFTTDVGATPQDFPSTVGSNPVAAFVMHAHNNGTAAGTAAADAAVSLAMTDMTDDFTYADISEDGVTTDNSRRLKESGSVATYSNEAGTTARARATPSLNGGDLRLTWSAHNTTGETQGSIGFFGGSRHQAKVMNHTFVQGSADTAESITGVGFAPDVIIIINSATSSYSGFNLSADASSGIGFAVRDGSQVSCGFRNEDGVATTDVNAYTSNAWYLTRVNDTGAQHSDVLLFHEAEGGV
jgi:hypothetical protein